MSLLSAHYLVFLLVVVALCGVLRARFSARKNMLLLASYYFYACWDWRFCGLLALITALNYLVGARLAVARRPAERRAWLALALAGGLGALAYFKYARFFVDSLALLLQGLGLHADMALLNLALPVGISFFTFQSLSYVFDIYRGQQAPARDVRDFALYVAFFPTLLAGPIARAHQLLPQLEREQAPAPDRVEAGLGLVMRGFVKKIVFADTLAATLVDPAFANPGSYAPLFLLLAVYAYSFQIYMDVSAYTDMARGSAALCGFELPQNFNRPYAATSVSNFWQRWHMSVSGFFRDYVFFALGGSRHGHVYTNLMLTFLAIGLWHGGNWKYVLYGALHGGMVCFERWLRGRRERRGADAVAAPSLARHVLQVALAFHFVALSRVFFRAADIGAGLDYLRAMTQFGQTAMPLQIGGVVVLAASALLHWALPDAGARLVDGVRRLPAVAQGLVIVMACYGLAALSSGQASFVYFQF